MRLIASIDFSSTLVTERPFPHLITQSLFSDSLAAKIYHWLEGFQEWGLTEADFYTQFEFSLFDVTLPDEICEILSPETVNTILSYFQQQFGLNDLELVGVTVHKLSNGHRIGIHNDFIGPEETHRLVVQLSPDWNESKGGYLMLFHSQRTEDVAKLVPPIVNSAFGFPISDKSYHAVSQVYDFNRYTLVYTMKAQ
jgi:Rps23 Pro-64 3,4-dihydroxylase Tpa1-like proline 4-hydroxylase